MPLVSTHGGDSGSREWTDGYGHVDSIRSALYVSYSCTCYLDHNLTKYANLYTGNWLRDLRVAICGLRHEQSQPSLHAGVLCTKPKRRHPAREITYP